MVQYNLHLLDPNYYHVYVDHLFVSDAFRMQFFLERKMWQEETFFGENNKNVQRKTTLKFKLYLGLEKTNKKHLEQVRVLGIISYLVNLRVRGLYQYISYKQYRTWNVYQSELSSVRGEFLRCSYNK